MPQHWHRKQTLINTERFINEELKSLEEKILGPLKDYDLETDVDTELILHLFSFLFLIEKLYNQ